MMKPMKSMNKKSQQMGNFTRGNPIVESMMGELMRGMMPKGVSSPKQMMQGGMGSMAKFAMGHGGVQGRFSGQQNLKKFLMQYSRYGKKTAKGVNLNKLLKF
jgi:hypothetical protein